MPTATQGDIFTDTKTGYSAPVLYDTKTGKKLSTGQTTDVGNFSNVKITPKVSTTTISNANKMAQVPGIQQKTEQYANTGVTTDKNTGIATYADGSVYNPKEKEEPTVSDDGISKGGYVGESYYPVGATLPVKSNGEYYSTTSYSPDSQRIIDNLEDLRKKNDSLTSELVASIQDQYEQLINKQKEANKSAEAGTQTALLMGGATGQGSSAQYAPISSGGIMQAQVNYGLQQISDLNAKEQAAILQAKQAGLSNDFQLQDKINGQIEQIRQEKVAAANKLNDYIIEQNQKAAEAMYQAEVDTAITDAFNAGLSNPGDIQKALKENGIYLTTKEVADTLQNINPDKAAVQSLIVNATSQGTDQALIARGVELANKGGSAIEVAQLLGASPAQMLDIKIKKLQYAKAIQDLTGSGGKKQVKVNGVDYYQNSDGSLETIPVPKSETTPVQLQAAESAKDLLDKFEEGKGTSAVGKSGAIGSFGYALIPGTERADFVRQFDNLKSLLSLDNVKLLKGQGQVSDAERKLLADASTKLDLSQSEAEFGRTLKNIVDILGKVPTPSANYVDSSVEPALSEGNALSTEDSFVNKTLSQ